MLGAHLGKLCLFGSQRGITIEEYGDAVTLLREFIKLLEYHTLFGGGEESTKSLKSSVTVSDIKVSFSAQRQEKKSKPLGFSNKLITPLFSANLPGLRQ